jgi:hypothetical protein
VYNYVYGVYFVLWLSGEDSDRSLTSQSNRRRLEVK